MFNLEPLLEEMLNSEVNAAEWHQEVRRVEKKLALPIQQRTVTANQMDTDR